MNKITYHNYWKNVFRKLILIITICLSLNFLTACDYEVVLYDEYVREETEVTKVELIEYNVDTTHIYTEMEIFDNDLLSVISTLDSELQNDFLSDLSTLGGITSKPKNNINRPVGYGILITYVDEGFTIITVSNIENEDVLYAGHFSSDLNLEYYNSFIWDEVTDGFKDIIYDYFEYSV